MNTSATGAQPALVTKIWLAFAVISLLFSVLTGTFARTLPWILLIVVLDLVAAALDAVPGLRPSVLRSQLLLIGVSAACSGVAFVLGGVATAPLALIPAYHGGLRAGRRGFAVTNLLAAGSAIGAFILSVPPGSRVTVPTLIAWLLAIALLGGLGTWSHRLGGGPASVEDPAGREAVALIGRLHEIADDLGTGLDAPAHAAAVLDDLASRARSDRSFLLVGRDPHHLVPVALRGATRVPWAGYGSGAHVLEQAWSLDAPAAFTTTVASESRAVLVLPMLDTAGARQGILLADRGAAQPFATEEVQTAAEVLSRSQHTLNAALLFGALRARASLEERRRLAREIHDGIAQELAALGYAIDASRMVANATDNPMAADLDALRQSLRTTLADVRGHIADLKMPQRPETGLGASLGAAVQSFGAVTGIRTTVSLKEEGVRLPSHIELLAYRLVMDTLADAQTGGAESVTVELDVSEEDLRVVVSHDGESSLLLEHLASDAWRGVGGDVAVEQSSRWVVVTITRAAEKNDQPGVGESAFWDPVAYQSVHTPLKDAP